ncbi:probable E3 ubiquitin-protein ligase RHG1A [Papaver somniferum]|uniref:probable E3 ubiquitin-protein ligase RHG1A n=1 Tax=Papaver somniferum TaxID=3469 RepID=UPI000E70275F|nr:probable E3 ubiquitin-protein ligase RHG1A [Papaver somniferum]
MGWMSRSLRSCIPLGRQERLAPIEGTVRSANNLVQQWDFRLSDIDIDIDELRNSILRELDERLGVQKRGLSEETISASLETKLIHIESSTSEDRNEETEICTICQAEYESGEKDTTLNCDHEYHVDCIKPWLRAKNACPICKRPAANAQLCYD